MENIRIKLQDISKSYFSDTQVTHALSKINLTFPDHGFIAITGESGSGKSTLLNIIAGLDTFDDGEMFVDGQPTFEYDEQDWDEYRTNRIGYVFQDYMLVGHYTALSNVMSPLLIMGYDKKQAEEVARKYIKEVGLEGFEAHKASKLSSGQMQRLSIARALAKNTGIIVADEPTGNLDSETGIQIVKLLKKLSRERLVLMVTHNYEQAAEYATRKIRLHDGSIVSDIILPETHPDNTALETQNANQIERRNRTFANMPKHKKEYIDTNKKNEHNKIKDFFAQGKTASFFAWSNCKTQKFRALLFTTLITMAILASFLFIGELSMYRDDTLTKRYNTAIFHHKDPTRLVLKRADGEGFSEKDVEVLYSVPYVTTVDSCDYANDINYYHEKGKDYKYRYGGTHQSTPQLPPSDSQREIQTVSFLDRTHFMMSTDCITEKNLAKGRLPEKRNEIALYSADENMLGSEQLFYFTAKNFWWPNQYYCQKLTVVGILKEETAQVYFSKEFCQILSLHMDYGEYRLLYNYDHLLGDYRTKDDYLPVIADDLKGNQARISYYHSSAISPQFYPEPMGKVQFQFHAYDKMGNLTGESHGQELYVLPRTESSHASTIRILEVSEEFFYTYYPKDRKSQQASVYLTSYAKVKTVIKKLKRLGYLAQSTYQLSTTDYNPELVNDRLTIIGVSTSGLIAIFLAQILILCSIMKIRLKDYIVLKFFGMKMQILRKISYVEICIYYVTAILLVLLCTQILRAAGTPALQEMMWYYDWKTYLTFVAYSLFTSAMTAAFFNRLLKKHAFSYSNLPS